MTTWGEVSKLIDQFGSERNVAGRIRQLREAQVDTAGRSWSQEELARRMTQAGYPMTHTSIWKIENPDKKSGGRSIPIGEAVGFARVLGVTLAELLLPEDAVREIDGWQRLQSAAEALDQIRSAWSTYVHEIEGARLAVRANPRVAERIQNYLDDAKAHSNAQVARVWINDADDEREAQRRERHVRDGAQSLPADAVEGYAPTPAVVAAQTALSDSAVPPSILARVGGV